MLITSSIIGFDLDGVILDHTANKTRLAARFGFDILPEKTNSDLMRDLLPEKIWREIQQMLYDREPFCLESAVAVGAIEVLANLKQNNIPFFLISRRKNKPMAEKALQHYNLWPRYFDNNNTFFVSSAEAKNEMAARLGITHYIDDQPSVLEKLSVVPHKFLFDPFGAMADKVVGESVASWFFVKQKLL